MPHDTTKRLIDFYPNLIIVLKNESTSYTLDDKLDNDTNYVNNTPFRAPIELEKKNELEILFSEIIEEAIKTERAILFINYNPLLLEIIADHEKTDKTNLLVLTFFHEDEELIIPDTYIKPDLLDIKFAELLDMTKYPFIHKFIIPLQTTITHEYLISLILKIFIEEE